MASIQSRTLQRLSELLGGRDNLAKALDVPKEDLARWLADTAKVPSAVFIRAVDLLLDETAVPGDDSDPGDSAGPRDCAPADGASGTWY